MWHDFDCHSIKKRFTLIRKKICLYTYVNHSCHDRKQLIWKNYFWNPLFHGSLFCNTYSSRTVSKRVNFIINSNVRNDFLSDLYSPKTDQMGKCHCNKLFVLIKKPRESMHQIVFFKWRRFFFIRVSKASTVSTHLPVSSVSSTKIEFREDPCNLTSFCDVFIGIC